MRALQYRSYGGPEVLEVARRPSRTPGPDRSGSPFKAASVNPFDWKLRSGMMAGGKPLEGPAYLGLDASGVVDEVGEGVTGVAVGDDVFGRGQQHPGRVRGAGLLGAPRRRRSTGPSPARWAVVGETAERVLRLLDVQAGRHPVHRRRRRRGRGGRRPVRGRPRDPGDRVGQPGQPGLPARDRGHPGALRPGPGQPGPRRAGRPGRRRPRRGRQDADRGPGRAGPRARARSSRSPTSGRRAPGPG